MLKTVREVYILLAASASTFLNVEVEMSYIMFRWKVE